MDKVSLAVEMHAKRRLFVSISCSVTATRSVKDNRKVKALVSRVSTVHVVFGLFFGSFVDLFFRSTNSFALSFGR